MKQLFTDALAPVIMGIIILAGKEFYDWARRKIKKDTTAKNFVLSFETDAQINNDLAYLRDKYDFNRTTILDFHNGTQSLNGFSFKNCSMRYEKTDLTTRPILMTFQSVPCSVFANLLVDLETSKDGFVSVNILPDHSDNLSIYHRMYGIKRCYYFRLGSSLLNGCIRLDCVNDIITLSADDIVDIKTTCQKILLYKENLKK